VQRCRLGCGPNWREDVCTVYSGFRRVFKTPSRCRLRFYGSRCIPYMLPWGCSSCCRCCSFDFFSSGVPSRLLIAAQARLMGRARHPISCRLSHGSSQSPSLHLLLDFNRWTYRPYFTAGWRRRGLRGQAQRAGRGIRAICRCEDIFFGLTDMVSTLQDH